MDHALAHMVVGLPPGDLSTWGQAFQLVTDQRYPLVLEYQGQSVADPPSCGSMHDPGAHWEVHLSLASLMQISS